MDWKRLLAYMTESVEQELLLRNEYLVTENRLLRQQIKGRIQLSDAERTTLAEIGKKLGKQALAEVATMAKPDTILAWHRRLIAQKFDGSAQRKAPGRPKINKELEALVVRMAQENRSWGYNRLAGALKHLGYTISDQTVGNILKRYGLPPAPERKKTTTWKEFIRIHMDVLVATDFFTAEVWTLGGLVTYYVLFFLHLGSRQIHVAGVTLHPNEVWMVQVARHVTMEEWGFLLPGKYLIHDRDGKYCPAFQQLINAAGVTRVLLPPLARISMPTRSAGCDPSKRSAYHASSCLANVPCDTRLGSTPLIIIPSAPTRAWITWCSCLRQAKQGQV